MLNAVEETKRRKEMEALKLPTPAPVGIATPSHSGDMLAIGGGSEPSKGKELVTTVGKAEDNTVKALLPARAPIMVKPKWHRPWKLYRYTYFEHV